MRHVFVETNWLVDYASPGHRQRPDAAALLARATAGKAKLYLPACCLAQARATIPRKFQPRHEADATRTFLAWARTQNEISAEQSRDMMRVLDIFEQSVKAELRRLETKLNALTRQPNAIEIIGLDDEVLERAATLSTGELHWLDPFDQAILAAVLVTGERLRSRGEKNVCFCELDSDLQPWDKHGNAKRNLQRLYDGAAVWVYGNYELTWPKQPRGWASSL
jgi:predicted nucleic acid-binding protein